MPDPRREVITVDGEEIELPTPEEVRRREAEEQRELDEYWARYNALSTWQQIREGGLTHWLSSTNKGVLFGIAGSVAVFLALALPPWGRWLSDDTVLTVIGALILVAFVGAMARGAVRLIRGD